MKIFTKLSSDFWIDYENAKLISLGADAQLMALYLVGNSHHNMLGIYYLPVTYIANDTKLSPRKVIATIQKLCAINYCVYDEQTQYVWVCDMVKMQLGDNIEAKDNRTKSLHAIWKDLPAYVPFLEEFYRKYKNLLELEFQENKIFSKTVDNLNTSKLLKMDFEGASDPLRRGYEGASKPLRSNKEVRSKNKEEISKKEEIEERKKKEDEKQSQELIPHIVEPEAPAPQTSVVGFDPQVKFLNQLEGDDGRTVVLENNFAASEASCLMVQTEEQLANAAQHPMPPLEALSEHYEFNQHDPSTSVSNLWHCENSFNADDASADSLPTTHSAQNLAAPPLSSPGNEISLPSNHIEPNKPPAEDIAIFEHWKKTMQHPNAVLDGKRRVLIRKALKLGYSAEELCCAITGCSLTPHNIGQNERGQRYDGLHIILRDADQIDRFMQNYQHPPQAFNKAHQRLHGNLQVANAWLKGDYSNLLA